jgi:hypothetical protein
MVILSLRIDKEMTSWALFSTVQLYYLPLRIDNAPTMQLYTIIFSNSAAILFRSELVNQQQYSYSTFRLFSPISYACKVRINQLDSYIIHEQGSNLTG